MARKEVILVATAFEKDLLRQVFDMLPKEVRNKVFDGVRFDSGNHADKSVYRLRRPVKAKRGRVRPGLEQAGGGR